MRDVLSNFLASTAEDNKNFYVFSGDHGYALFDDIRKRRPNQFINTGVTEQAMIGCAAGMAKSGKKAVVYGLSAFVPIRVVEFVKMDICYEQLPVIILGDGAGVVYTTLGASHQCVEDIACLKSLPIKIYSPADKFEMDLCLKDAFQQKMPTYIRIGKSDKPPIHADNKSLTLKPFLPIAMNAKDTVILATGSMVSTGLDLAKKYQLSLYSCPVLNFYDSSEIISELKKYKNVITLEEHSVNGGLGSSIADYISENGLSAKLTKFGVRKFFTKGRGSYEYAIKFHELDFHSIETKLKNLNLV